MKTQNIKGYYVGRLNKVKQGSKLRVMRTRIIKGRFLKKTVEEITQNDGWGKAPKDAKKVSRYLPTQLAARQEKWMLEGKVRRS